MKDELDKYIPGYSSMTDEAQREAWYNLPTELKYKANSEQLLVNGRGENFLDSFELSRESENHICDYPNLLSFDVPHSAFQKYATENYEDTESETYKKLLAATDAKPVLHTKAPEGYECRFDGEWLRLFKDDRMHYASLYDATSYVITTAVDRVEDWIYKKHPFELSMNIGEDGAVTFSTDNETEHDKAFAIIRKLRDITLPMHEELKEHFEKQAPVAYMIEGTDDEGCPELTLIMRNTTTSAMVRPSHIIRDMNSLIGDHRELEAMIEQYTKAIKEKLERE